MSEKIIFKGPHLDNTETDIFVISLYTSMMITQTVYENYRQGNLDIEKIKKLYNLLQEKLKNYKDWEKSVVSLTQLAFEITLIISMSNFNRILDKISIFSRFLNEEVPQDAFEKFRGVILVEAVKMTILKLLSITKIIFPEKRDAKLAPLLRIEDFKLAQNRLGETDPFEDFFEECSDEFDITREDVLLLSALVLLDSKYIFTQDDTFENIYINSIMNLIKQKEGQSDEEYGGKN